MSETAFTQTDDPENPWGLNMKHTEKFTYKGAPIPVIDSASSRDEMLRYIRILEARLHLTHLYVLRPDDLPADVADVGVTLEHDLPPKKVDIIPAMPMVRLGQNQGERVAMLARGLDRVGCLEIGEKIRAENQDYHDEA